MMLRNYWQKLSKNSQWILITLGSVSWVLVMVKNGIVGDYGMAFWGANAHDGLWHVALAQSLAKGSFEMPIYSGEIIKNYHIGYDLLLSMFHKITFVPILNLYYQILPLLVAVLVGLGVYKFTIIFTKSGLKAFWAIIFIYFGGSFGWLINLLRGNSASGESMFWSMQGISTLINPPFALSMILVFSGLFYLLLGIEKEDKKYFAASTILFGLLAIVKVYASILILAGLFIAAIYRIVKDLRLDLFKVFTGVVLLTFLILIGQKADYGGTFIWKPFWFLETMMAAHDRLNWPQMASAMVSYKSGENWVLAALTYGVALIIFVVGNLGTRILGLWSLVNINWKKDNQSRETTDFNSINLMLVTVVVLGILIPTLFIQKGINWNTIQFFYYSLTLLSIYSGIYVANVISKINKFRNNDEVMISYSKVWTFILLVVFLTIPTTFGTLQFYLSDKPSAVISREELEALRFLESQPKGIVLTQPHPRNINVEHNKPYTPLYLYESTACVSALSKKPVYLEDEVNLIITGFKWEERRNNSFDFFINPDKSFLNMNNITYLYVIKLLNDYNFENIGMKKLFENSEVIIYKV